MHKFLHTIQEYWKIPLTSTLNSFDMNNFCLTIKMFNCLISLLRIIWNYYDLFDSKLFSLNGTKNDCDDIIGNCHFTLLALIPSIFRLSIC